MNNIEKYQISINSQYYAINSPKKKKIFVAGNEIACGSTAYIKVVEIKKNFHFILSLRSRLLIA